MVQISLTKKKLRQPERHMEGHEPWEDFAKSIGEVVNKIPSVTALGHFLIVIWIF